MCQGIKKGLDLEVAEGVQRQLASASAIEVGAIGSYHILGIGELTGCQIKCSVLGGGEIRANEIAVDSDDVRGIVVVGVKLADECLLVVVVHDSEIFVEVAVFEKCGNQTAILGVGQKVAEQVVGVGHGFGEQADEEVGGIIDVVKGISEVRQGRVDVFETNKHEKYLLSYSNWQA